MFKDCITLFCRFGPARAQAFSRTVVRGVSFEGGVGAKQSTTGEKSLNRALVLIPFAAAEGYVSPAAWQALLPEQRAAHWTLRPGDVFVRGEVQLLPETSPAAYLADGGGYCITSVLEKGSHSALAHFAVAGGCVFLQGGGLA